MHRLSFDDDVLGWLRQALRESHADERREHEEAINRLQNEYSRLGKRAQAMYVDKLDGRIDQYFFDKLSRECRIEQDRCLRDIALFQSGEQSYLDEGVQILELAQSAGRLFAKQAPHAKRQLLNFVYSNSVWKDDTLSVTFRQPFELLSESAISTLQKKNAGVGNSVPHPEWLRG